MKKFVVLFFVVLLCCIMILPSFASMTSSFGSYTNLFDPSDVVQARFYTDSDNYQVNNFYSVNLKGNTDYTFISTKGSRSFYSGQLVYDESSYSSVYSYDSLNLLNSSLFESGTRSGVTLTYDNGYIILNGTATSNFSFGCYQNISFVDGGYISAHYISGTTSNTIYLSASTGSSNQSCYLDTGDTFESQYFPYDSISLVYIWIDSGTTFDNFKFKAQVSDDFLNSYYDFYSDPTYVDYITSVSYFNTGFVKNNTTFLIGINDILSGSTSNLFSYNQSSENEFYLIEGKLTVDQISNIIDGNNYQNGYNTGYDQGYSLGQTDGIESSNTFPRLIYTVLSSPFVIISNTLNFEIFGLNVLNLVKVILTILIIAWVFTRLKGRE